MKFRHALLAASASVALIGSVQTSGAETLPMVPQTGVVALSDFFYMSIGGTVQVIETPKFNYGRNFDLVNVVVTDMFADSTRIITGGPAITVGYNLPWNIGTRPRIELAAMANFGRARNSADSTAVPGTRAVLFTDLGTGTLTGVGFADTQRIDLKVVYENADGALRFKTDIPIGPMFTLTPSLGAVFGFTQSRHDLTSRSNLGGAVDYTNRLQETLTNWRGGAEIGFDATVSLGQHFKLHGGMTGAAYYQHAHINARDCVQASLPGVPACSLPGTLVSTASRSDENYGVRAGASLGATVSTGWMNVTFMGTGAYSVNQPGVENPRFPENPQKGVKVGWEDRFSYGGYIMATFPLN